MTWAEVAAHEVGHAVCGIAVGGQVDRIHVGTRHGNTDVLMPNTATDMDLAVMAMGGWATTWWRWPLDDVELAVALVGRDGLREAMRRAAAIVAERATDVDELTELLIARDVEAVAARLRAMT